ncbi:helix-turn-helix domain-containing protein [Aminobacter sp. AP02]|uniref:helix-turn-helix domain-containing protein n=1 Tax=Aminobacter sp. AP02 TaxID=2135737 RepID=UPI000D6A855E|nr:helix-turn-helix domain-containing protein [Aminobacter sp. AP02]PWK63865.1 putative transcriptional regulator [Aminobacter sp. AP02]
MADEFDDADSPDWTRAKSRTLDASAKLKLIRGTLDTSQVDFAVLLGIPVATLQNWEQRRTEPDAVARALIDLIHDDPKEMRARLLRRNAA